MNLFYFLYWLDGLQTLFMLLLLCNGPTIAEYEAYWLMGFQIISPCGARWQLFILKWYMQIDQS